MQQESQMFSEECCIFGKLSGVAGKQSACFGWDSDEAMSGF